MKRKKSILTIFFSLSALCAPVLVFGQILFPPPDPAAVPLDPAGWLMLAAGGAMMAKKMYREKFAK